MKRNHDALRNLSFLVLIVLAGLCPPAAVHGAEYNPAIWRKLVRASTTVHEAFLSRSPQIVIYEEGLVVFRDDDFQKGYRQVQLSGEDRIKLYLTMQSSFGLSSLTNEWLENELPYARSIEEPYQENNNKVTVWIGLHTPASLHTYSTGMLKARSGNSLIAPAWNAFYEFNNFLAGFTYPEVEPYVPDRVEIAVQKLPRYMADQSDLAVEWPLDAIDLAAVKGKRPRGYRTLSGSSAREAYRLLNEHQAVRSGDQVYLVWVRPLLLP